jgi:phage terminase large subunit GpA-like protein
MKLYGVIFDNWDGSASLRWFSDKKIRQVFADDYEYFNEVQLNQGSASVTITLPDDVTPEDLGIFSVDI